MYEPNVVEMENSGFVTNIVHFIKLNTYLYQTVLQLHPFVQEYSILFLTSGINDLKS